MEIKAELQIVKIGGNLIHDSGLLNQSLDAFASIPGQKILIHGGGKKATEHAKKLSLQTEMIDGRRITNEDTLEVIVMVYGGLINKTIVAALQARGIPSIGLSGADGDIIRSHKRDHPTIDYGMVGDIDMVHTSQLHALLAAGLTPVICPITHDGNGQLLNTNADTIAAEVAIALSDTYAVSLKYSFEYAGVLADLSKAEILIPEINFVTAESLKNDGTIHSGLLPKIDNALYAKKNGVNKVCICGIHNLLNEENVTWIV